MMSTKKSNIDTLTHKVVEVVGNDKVKYSHIKFTGSDKADTFRAEGTVEALSYEQKIIGEEKSDMKRATYNFEARVNIHNGNHFAGLYIISRELVSVHKVEIDAVDVLGEEATIYDASGYHSTRIDEIIRGEIASAFYTQKPLATQHKA